MVVQNLVLHVLEHKKDTGYYMSTWYVVLSRFINMNEKISSLLQGVGEELFLKCTTRLTGTIQIKKNR